MKHYVTESLYLYGCGPELHIEIGDSHDDYRYTPNALGLRNGSLGRILAALPVVDCDDACCVADFGGVEHKLTTHHLHALVHAYSITVHKSQGSQFARVIVPVKETGFLDQSLIYTAVTRGVQQVVLVGDEQVVLDAIRAPATATRRYTALPGMFLAKCGGEPNSQQRTLHHEGDI